MKLFNHSEHIQTEEESDDWDYSCATEATSSSQPLSKKGRRKHECVPGFPPLKFKNGVLVPATAVVSQEGKLYFVAMEDGSKVRAFSRRQFADNRLKYPDGRLVALDAVIREEICNGGSGKYYFVRAEDGTETQVFSAASISGQRLKFSDGTLVPSNAVIQMDEKKYYASINGGAACQVFTAHEWSASRLKYLDESLVPFDAIIREVTLGKQGRTDRKLYFAKIGDNGVEREVFTSKSWTNRRLHYADGRFVAPNAVIREEVYNRSGCKHYFAKVGDEPEVRVYTANSMTQIRRRLRAGEVIQNDRVDLPKDEVSVDAGNLADVDIDVLTDGYSSDAMTHKRSRLPVSHEPTSQVSSAVVVEADGFIFDRRAEASLLAARNRALGFFSSASTSSGASEAGIAGVRLD